jgi:biofilm PGA synthesis N-glycosyltransferase PgaC
MAETVLWLSLLCIIYVYVGYPLVLMTWRRVMRRKVDKHAWEPAVSLIIAMHNEEHNVRPKLRNCFEMDYPAGRLQIIISLDAPTDGTEALVRQYQDQGVEIISSPIRRGKAAALNSAMTIARGEIVLFADARQLFDSQAVRELVANFADPSVGAVSGELLLLDQDGRQSKNAVGLYWRYEKALRGMESDIHSVPGTTGAIYAIRRNLFTPLPPNTVLDDVVTPLRIVLAGKRAVFDSAARAYDSVTESPEVEYQKKRRTLMGNYDLLTEMPELLLPWRNPIFIQFVSHKLGRLIVPYCLAALFVSNFFILHGLYLTLLAGQMLFYLLACAGWLISVQRASRGDAQPGTLGQIEKPI